MALKTSPSKKGEGLYKKQDKNKHKNVKKIEETNPQSTKQFKIMKRKSFPVPRKTDPTTIGCTSYAPITSRKSQIHSSGSPFSPVIYDFAPRLPVCNPFMPYYPSIYSPITGYPISHDWSSPAWPGMNTMYNYPVPPIPIGVFNPIFISLPMLTGQPLFAEPFISIPPALPIDESMFNISFETVVNYNTDQIVPYPEDCNAIGTSHLILEEVTETRGGTERKDFEDPLEYYLRLPKDLFPKANMLTVDSNVIINEFCKELNIQKHCPWILDLEFGIPNEPVTRPIAIYDVQFNSIHCKNTPGAIHPGFESCSQDFKKIFQFYYDCVVSSWYRGYMITNNDTSVANFQSWLQQPMEVLGMCWS